MDQISDLRETAPEWYEARKQELSGRDYPKLANVPVSQTYQADRSGLVKSAAEREAIREAFFSHPRSEPTYLTPEQIRDWGLKISQRLEAMNEPVDYLSDADVKSLRARFERPRARR